MPYYKFPYSKSVSAGGSPQWIPTTQYVIIGAESEDEAKASIEQDVGLETLLGELGQWDMWDLSSLEGTGEFGHWYTIGYDMEDEDAKELHDAGKEDEAYEQASRTLDLSVAPQAEGDYETLGFALDDSVGTVLVWDAEDEWPENIREIDTTKRYLKLMRRGRKAGRRNNPTPAISAGDIIKRLKF